MSSQVQLINDALHCYDGLAASVLKPEVLFLYFLFHDASLQKHLLLQVMQKQ